MTKKKTPTPLKKVETKKATAKPKWKQTGEIQIPGIGKATTYDVTLPPEMSQSLFEAIQAENNVLRTLLSKKQSEEAVSVVKEFHNTGKIYGDQSCQTAAPTPILEIMLSQFDKNLSRFYNSMNTLDSFADRLKPSDQAQMPIGPAPLPPSNIIGRMERLLSDFNHLNNRLEATNNYLSEIV